MTTPGRAGPGTPAREHLAAVALGSNVGDRLAHLASGFAALERLDPALRRSPVYETPPLGPPQPAYLNAVALVRTTLEPLPLLDFLLDAERAAGRVRRERWGPRTLDLDLLTYDDVALAGDRLVLPHPGLATRAFVLVPLAAVDPAHVVAGAGTAAALLEALPAAERAAVVPFDVAPR